MLIKRQEIMLAFLDDQNDLLFRAHAFSVTTGNGVASRINLRHRARKKQLDCTL